ncbi:hypothetical protein E2562_019814 [Oryza meyeriana var. granulata]|uniref:Uncharacterized protein n=1 Tax=Oryza meyeriana var. granulata TaxID=110450 RepID=A0A6G1DKV6_9ORYZ|nr:hypothetical protein E2562_019814 [Oryza meyeriana var. granulata]
MRSTAVEAADSRETSYCNARSESDWKPAAPGTNIMLTGAPSPRPEPESWLLQWLADSRLGMASSICLKVRPLE